MDGDTLPIFPVKANSAECLIELSRLQIAQKTHQQFVDSYLRDTLFIYSASDATAIPMREKPVKKEKPQPKPKRKRGRPKKGEKATPKTPTILQQQLEMTDAEAMLSLLPVACDVGVHKRMPKGTTENWVGGKLHLSVVDGDIPITGDLLPDDLRCLTDSVDLPLDP